MAVEQDMTPDESSLKLWAIGTAVRRKQRGSMMLTVTTLEHLPLQNGPIADNRDIYTERVGDSFGGSSSQSLTGTKMIEAEWTPYGDNHLYTAPMVEAGEAVKIYRIGDQNKFYWTTLWTSAKIRRKDYIVFGAANEPGFGTSLTPENMYYLEIDTDGEKLIRLSTSLSDGEKFKYELLFDANGRTATLSDDAGNVVTIDSESNNVSMQDASGGIFETRDGHPRIFGPKGVLIEGPTVEVRGDTSFSDSVTIQGLTSMNGGIQASGDSGGGTVMEIQGSLRIQNDLTVEGYSYLIGGHTGHD